MGLKQMLKRFSIFFVMFLLFCATNVQNPALAITPQGLYDKAWKLIYTKYVDDTQNQQNWERWRHKYDNVIKDEEDAYVAIGTMVDSLGDVYTKFLTPKEYKEESERTSGLFLETVSIPTTKEFPRNKVSSIYKFLFV